MAVTTRLADLQHFYALLAILEERLGGTRRLADCHGRMGWPERGVYFFFEASEKRTDSGSSPRVVRVGTHALTTTSRTTLWNRLAQHRGSTTGGGNHRGSIFRLIIGGSLKGQYEGTIPTSWGVAADPAAAAQRLGLDQAGLLAQEAGLERKVSEHIGAMPFLWLPVDDPPGPDSLRRYIERNSIALLSNYGGPAIDPPSANWLGQFSDRDRVQRSGLWNSNHVDDHYDPAFLTTLKRLIQNPSGTATTYPGTPPRRSSKQNTHDNRGRRQRSYPLDPINLTVDSQQLRNTLFLIPCSSRKRQGGATTTACSPITDELPPRLATALKDARGPVLANAELNASGVFPAWRRYTGLFFDAALPALEQSMNAKLHVLIISGGYGVIKACEPIGTYSARLTLREWPKGLLQEVLAAYASRHELRSVRGFLSLSTDYARIVAQTPWKSAGITDACIIGPKPTRGAMRKAPRAEGEAFAAFLAGQLTQDWTSSNGVELEFRRVGCSPLGCCKR